MVPSEGDTSGNTSYWTHVSDAASVAAFRREDPDPLLSAETIPEQASIIDFKTFAQEEPERLFELLSHLRPEWQEIFIEYFILGKSQSFIAHTHGFIQTRCWQALRMIEQAIGAFIVLGTNPEAKTLRPILEKVEVEKTEYGSLASMIEIYSRTQDYTHVAEIAKAPVPAVRKIFRPTIRKLLESKDLKAAAVGAYLRNLTHQASLKGAGLSKRYVARIDRLKKIRFDAPPLDPSPLISYGPVSTLNTLPWIMLEISSEYRMTKITPFIQKYGKRLFGKKAAQVFAPLDSNGELKFGYMLARSTAPNLPRILLRIRGISETAARYDDTGSLTEVITIPDSEVQKLIAEAEPKTARKPRVGDYVRILTGESKNYCGIVKSKNIVEVTFPSGRRFLVDFEINSLEILSPTEKQTFWGPITQ